MRALGWDVVTDAYASALDIQAEHTISQARPDHSTGAVVGNPDAGPGAREAGTFHRCSCGLAYDRAAWLALPFIGRQDTFDGSGSSAEMRNCLCGSTMMGPLRRPPLRVRGKRSHETCSDGLCGGCTGCLADQGHERDD